MRVACVGRPQQRHCHASLLRARASRCGAAGVAVPRCAAAGDARAGEATPRVERPSFSLSAEAAFEAQWEALRQNDTPHVDAGVEVLYNFADVDLFMPRSTYFGHKQDLGQFERFRRVLHTPQYRALLSHTQRRVLSTLAVSELEVRQRVAVTAFRAGQQAEYCLTMKQQLGGRRDGWWLAASLACDAAPAPADEDTAQ